VLASIPLLSSFLATLTPLREVFPRRRTFENFVAVLLGMAMAQGTGTVSSALVAADLTDKKHWSSFYRLFSRATWSVNALGLKVAELVVHRFVPSGPLFVAVDDTLHAKGGKNVFGAGIHHDPLTSTRSRAQFQFGHCWVTLAIVVDLPFALRPRALPVLFRLNMPAKMAAKWGVVHQKKTELAAALIALLAARFPDREIRLVNDNLYSCETLLHHLPANVNMIGRLNLEAALHDPVEAKPAEGASLMGRPRKWGPRRATPKQEAEADTPWEERVVHIYGRDVTVRFKTWTAFWRSGGPVRLLRCVVVWRPNGQYPYEAFFSTESSLVVEQILEGYARRWSLEVTFHETKACIGADRPQCWTPAAVERTAPSGMLLYSLVVLWYADHGHHSPAAAWPRRPWYRRKRTASFEDMIATLRRATLHPGLSRRMDPGRDPEKVADGLLRWYEEAA
jgi:hypothetical protein